MWTLGTVETGLPHTSQWINVHFHSGDQFIPDHFTLSPAAESAKEALRLLLLNDGQVHFRETLPRETS